MKTRIAICLLAVTAIAAHARISGGGVSYGAYVGGDTNDPPVVATNTVAVGNFALLCATNGPALADTFIGTAAGAHSGGVVRSIGIGAGALMGAHDLDGCIAIGVNVGRGWDSRRGWMQIGDHLFGDSDNLYLSSTWVHAGDGVLTQGLFLSPDGSPSTGAAIQWDGENIYVVTNGVMAGRLVIEPIPGGE